MQQFSSAVVRNLGYAKRTTANVESREMASTNWNNTSGAYLYPGDVVILDLLNAVSVKLVDLADTVRIPLVVLVSAEPGGIVKCYTPGYGVVRVIADDGAVDIGEVIIPSDTERYATAFVPTIYELIATYKLGVAVTSKLAGSPGEIQVLLWP
jgi:hypothetical protein